MLKKLLSVFFAVCLIASAEGCKEANAKEYFADKTIEAIFVGKVVSVKAIPPLRSMYIVEVGLVLKGTMPEVVRLYSIESASSGLTIPNMSYVFSVRHEPLEKEWLRKDETAKMFPVDKDGKITRQIGCRCFSLSNVSGQDMLDRLQREARKDEERTIFVDEIKTVKVKDDK